MNTLVIKAMQWLTEGRSEKEICAYLAGLEDAGISDETLKEINSAIEFAGGAETPEADFMD